jgi:cell division protein FtsZ
MGRRQKNAQKGLEELRKYTDTLITVPNDRLLKVAPKDLSLELAFRLADDVLRQGIQGISELITQPGLINVDFSHICGMMRSGGGALLSIGHGHGVNKASDAIHQALNHPILESIPLENATGIICNFTGGTDLSFLETSEALIELQKQTSNQACIIPGIICNEEMYDRVQVILVITGLSGTPVAAPPQAQEPVRRVQEAPAEAEQEFVSVEPQPRKPATMQMSHDSNSLDIPAFLRRRVRF